MGVCFVGADRRTVLANEQAGYLERRAFERRAQGVRFEQGRLHGLVDGLDDRNAVGVCGDGVPTAAPAPGRNSVLSVFQQGTCRRDSP